MQDNKVDNDIYEKLSSGIMGFATADALGVPIEFTMRQSHINNPLTEMVGYGSHNVPKGTWSDDTSMTIATMDSITEKKGIDYDDMMDKFCSWYGEAKYTATDKLFDIGIGTRKALMSYHNKVTSAVNSGGREENNNGNGSLMRMLPVVFYLHYANLSDNEVTKIINDCSSLTHGQEISKLGCRIYFDLMDEILDGKSIKDAYEELKNKDYSKWYSEETISKYSRILDGSIENVQESSIKSSGFVVDTLEAAIWCSLNTNSYEESAIKAVNLGDDTDTVGAITGSITGVSYGKVTIPERWISKLRKKDYLDELCKNYAKFLAEINLIHSPRINDEESFNYDDELFKMLTGGSTGSDEEEVKPIKVF